MDSVQWSEMDSFELANDLLSAIESGISAEEIAKGHINHLTFLTDSVQDNWKKVHQLYSKAVRLLEKYLFQFSGY